MRTALLLTLIASLAVACAASPRPPAPDPRIETARSEMAAIDEAIQRRFLETGRLPRSIGDPGPDPWGHPYLYEARSDGRPVYRLSSAGPDGTMGTADDLQIGAIR